jgi:hypothetical protein
LVTEFKGLRVLENRMLRRILGPKRYEIDRRLEKTAY